MLSASTLRLLEPPPTSWEPLTKELLSTLQREPGLLLTDPTFAGSQIFGILTKATPSHRSFGDLVGRQVAGAINTSDPGRTRALVRRVCEGQ